MPKFRLLFAFLAIAAAPAVTVANEYASPIVQNYGDFLLISYTNPWDENFDKTLVDADTIVFAEKNRRRVAKIERPRVKKRDLGEYFWTVTLSMESPEEESPNLVTAELPLASEAEADELMRNLAQALADERDAGPPPSEGSTATAHARVRVLRDADRSAQDFVAMMKNRKSRIAKNASRRLGTRLAGDKPIRIRREADSRNIWLAITARSESGARRLADAVAKAFVDWSAGQLTVLPPAGESP